MLRPSCSPAAVNAHARRSAPALAVSLLLASLVVSTPAARPEEEPTLLQRLRELFNLVRPIAAGGSRAEVPAPSKGPVAAGGGVNFSFESSTSFISPLAKDVPGIEQCLLSPWLGEGHRNPGEIPVALSPSGAPPIASRSPLVEVRIERGGRMVWQNHGTAGQPLPNPLAWPLPPLHPGESALLHIRTQGTASHTFSTMEVRRTADANPIARPEASAALLSTLLEQKRQAEAVELLFRGDLEANPELRHLAREAVKSGCRGLSALIPIAW